MRQNIRQEKKEKRGQIYLNLTPFFLNGLVGVFVFKFPFFKRGGILPVIYAMTGFSLFIPLLQKRGGSPPQAD